MTEKVQQASTITLAPRCSHASDSPGPAMVEFLSNPFIPCTCAPNISILVAFTPYTTCSMRPEGGPLGQAAKPRPKGCGPLPLPSGQATLQFWAVGGAMLSLTPKSYLRLVWHQYVVCGGCGCTPVPRKKKGENGKNKVSNPLGPNFCKAHISKLVCAPPFFFAFIAKSTSNSTQKCEKKNFAFFGPPPKKNFFRPCHHQNHPNSGVFCIHLRNDAKRPKKRAHIYSKRS